jgi:hypothetical protein
MHRRSLAFVMFVVTSCRLSVGEAKVDVNCQGVGPGINCAVAYKSGPAPVVACWRFNAYCKNGTHVTAEACQRLEPGQLTQKFIPLSEVKNVQECDAQIRDTVDHLVITASR